MMGVLLILLPLHSLSTALLALLAAFAPFALSTHRTLNHWVVVFFKEGLMPLNTTLHVSPKTRPQNFKCLFYTDTFCQNKATLSDQ